MSQHLNITDEQAEKLANDAAKIAAPIYEQETDWKTISEEELASAIRELLRRANTKHNLYSPDARAGHLRVEVLPDLNAAHVWLRIADLHVNQEAVAAREKMKKAGV